MPDEQAVFVSSCGIPPLMSDTPAHCRFAAEAGILDLIYPRENPAALAELFDRLFGDARGSPPAVRRPGGSGRSATTGKGNGARWSRRRSDMSVRAG